MIEMEASPPRDTVRALQRVMREIEHMLDELTPAQQPLVTNALLNLAANRLISDEGSGRAASIFAQLASVVATGVQPTAEDAVELTAARH